MEELVLRAVDGIDCEAKLETELPIPVVRELSMSLFGDGDLCRIVVCKVGATKTTAGAMFVEPNVLFTFETLPAQTVMDPCLGTGMQPAATVKDAPLEMCGGAVTQWLCNLGELRARAEHFGAAGATVADCGGRDDTLDAACVETDEPIEAHDRESGALSEGVRIPFGVGVQ
jgi:hypothetical protein